MGCYAINKFLFLIKCRCLSQNFKFTGDLDSAATGTDETKYRLRQTSVNFSRSDNFMSYGATCLTLRLLISYMYGAPSKARNANVVYIWTYVWQR